MLDENLKQFHPKIRAVILKSFKAHDFYNDSTDMRSKFDFVQQIADCSQDIIHKQCLKYIDDYAIEEYGLNYLRAMIVNENERLQSKKKRKKHNQKLPPRRQI